MNIQITSDDISLFHLAMHYFNDAMQWWCIAKKNGLTDPDDHAASLSDGFRYRFLPGA